MLSVLLHNNSGLGNPNDTIGLLVYMGITGFPANKFITNQTSEQQLSIPISLGSSVIYTSLFKHIKAEPLEVSLLFVDNSLKYLNIYLNNPNLPAGSYQMSMNFSWSGFAYWT